MKNLVICFIIAFCVAGASTSRANFPTNGIKELKDYISAGTAYPEKAKQAAKQGNSIITFALKKGRLSDVNIFAELGLGCDVAVLNQILSYTGFNNIKDGMYAVNVEFRLDGISSPIENAQVKIPEDHTEVKVTVNAKVESANLSRDFGTRFDGTSDNTVFTAGKPRVIIDQKEIEYQSLKDIDPKDIYSIEILKTASSIAEYGLIAPNGLIVLTTKSNRAKKQSDAKN